MSSFRILCNFVQNFVGVFLYFFSYNAHFLQYKHMRRDTYRNTHTKKNKKNNGSIGYIIKKNISSIRRLGERTYLLDEYRRLVPQVCRRLVPLSSQLIQLLERCNFRIKDDLPAASRAENLSGRQRMRGNTRILSAFYVSSHCFLDQKSLCRLLGSPSHPHA